MEFTNTNLGEDANLCVPLKCDRCVQGLEPLSNVQTAAVVVEIGEWNVLLTALHVVKWSLCFYFPTPT